MDEYDEKLLQILRNTQKELNLPKNGYWFEEIKVGTTNHKKLFLKVLNCVSRGCEVQYDEYWKEKRDYSTGYHHNVLYCKGFIKK